jgi:hypothetical protein
MSFRGDTLCPLGSERPFRRGLCVGSRSVTGLRPSRERPDGTLNHTVVAAIDSASDFAGGIAANKVNGLLYVGGIRSSSIPSIPPAGPRISSLCLGWVRAPPWPMLGGHARE